MNNVKASVVMPVYNAERFVGDAIESVLRQTFEDFEFLIFDDGSRDRSLEIIRSYQDPRIRLIISEENVGYVTHLNRGIDEAKGKYYIRMDADDICLPTRFEKQLDFMEKHPEVGLCGTWVETFGVKRRFRRPPAHDSGIRLHLLNGTTIDHPTAIIRTRVLREHQLYYRQEYLYTEDYDMWVRLAKLTQMANIPEVLLLYRMHDSNVGVVKKERQMKLVGNLRVQQYRRVFGRSLQPFEESFARQTLDYGALEVRQLQRVIRELKRSSEAQHLFEPEDLRRFVHDRLARDLYNSRSRSASYLKNLVKILLHYPAVSRGLSGIALAIMRIKLLHSLGFRTE